MNDRLSVIVPVYGNETTLRELKDRLTTTLAAMGAEYELIFVDDASPDGSWGVIEAMASEDPRVVGVRLAANVGQPRAYCAGIDASGGSIIGSIDADLEHPPEAIPRLLEALREGHDLVVARRVGRAPGRLRLAGSRTVNLLARIVGLPVSDVGSTFMVGTPVVAAAFQEVIGSTDRQMLLPTLFQDAASNATMIDVEMSVSTTSAYTLRRTVGLFAEFVAAVLAPALARRTLVASGCILVLGVHPRLRRGAVRVGIPLAGLGVAGLVLPSAFRRAPTESMYVVAERTGGGLGSPQRTPAG